MLPPYTELVRFDAGPRLRGDELRAAARELLRGHLARRPATNPFERFGAQLAADLPELLAGDAARYHDYAFATVRMSAPAFEITASHVDWLLGDDGRGRVGGADPDRRGLEGAVASARPPAGVRPAAAGRHGGGGLGRGDDRARSDASAER